MHDAQVDLVLQGHVHCAERVHAQFNGTVVTLPVNEGAGPASQVCTADCWCPSLAPCNGQPVFDKHLIEPKRKGQGGASIGSVCTVFCVREM